MAFLDNTGLERLWTHILAKLGTKADNADIVTAIETSGTGAAYTATVDGIDSLTPGVHFTMIPHVTSTSAMPTLNVNGLGAKEIYRPISNSSSASAASLREDWLTVNKPVEVMYNGIYWVTTSMPRINMADAYSTLPIENGGTGATTAAGARTNLGITDTKVTTNTVSPTSETAYYPTFSLNATSGDNNTLSKHASLKATMMHGTTSAVGKTQITLGNGTPAGTAGNMVGRLALYSNDTGAGFLTQAATNNWPEHVLPAISGTVLNHRNSKIPIGTSISANSDLNTIAFLKVGSYYCTLDSTVATFSNCPTTQAFMMEVYSPLSQSLDDETTNAWCYRVRKIMTYTGDEFVQKVNSNGTAGTFNYGPWYRIITSTNGVVPVAKGGTGATTKGTTLLSNIGITSGTGEPPSSGTAGTIYIQYSE